MNYGIESNAGFMVITGEVGTGKTTLTRSFLRSLGKDVVSALVFNPSLTRTQLLRSINRDFGLPGSANSKESLMRELNGFLLALCSKGKRAVLVVDEAQNLGRDCLEELRMLSNLETEKEKLIQIILFGQPELRELLMEKSMRQLNQRISLRHHLVPLNPLEVADYIELRIAAVSQDKRITFSRSVVDDIYRYSGGIPRIINVLCEKSLVAAFLAGADRINRKIVHIAIEDLEKTAGSSPPCFDMRQEEGLSLRRVTGFVFSWKKVFLGTAGFSLVLLLFLLWGVPADHVAQSGRNAVVGEALWYDVEQELYLTDDKANSLAVSLMNLQNLIFRDEGLSGESFSSDYGLIDLGKKDIVGMLNERGLIVERLVVNLESLERFGSAVIILLNKHDIVNSRYVLLENAGKNLVIADPLKGKISLSREEFSDSWFGDVIIYWKRIGNIGKNDYGDGLSIRSLKMIQGILYNHGFYKGAIDGVMGSRTALAIERFQRENMVINRYEYGKFGPETYYWLSKLFYDESLAAESS